MVPPADAVTGPAEATPSRLALVIEDGPDVPYSFAVLLRLLRHRVEEAATGLEGLEKLLTLRPDVALIDVGLAGLNGYSLSRAVRESAEGAGLFLVGLTGYSTVEDCQNALDAGFDAHLPKPVEESALLDLLARSATRC